MVIDYNLRQVFGREDVLTTETVKYIFIEKVYFPKNMIGMVTRNWRQKPQMSLYKGAKGVVEGMCLHYFCEKRPHRKKTSG